MKRLIVDMDGVLADIYARLIAMEQEDSGRRKTIQEVTGIPEDEAFPRLLEHLRRPGFFREMVVVADSQDVLAKLNSAYELFIVSAATEFPLSLAEKQSWLQEHFPFITWQQLVFCGSKRVVHGDIMIDDQFNNLDSFAGRTLLFSQPHNQSADNRGHERIESWPQIADRLLGANAKG